MTKDQREKLVKEARLFVNDPDRPGSTPALPTDEQALLSHREQLIQWRTACEVEAAQFHKGVPLTFTPLITQRLDRVNEALEKFEAARQLESQQRAFAQDGRGVMWARLAFFAAIVSILLQLWQMFGTK